VIKWFLIELFGKQSFEFFLQLAHLERETHDFVVLGHRAFRELGAEVSGKLSVVELANDNEREMCCVRTECKSTLDIVFYITNKKKAFSAIFLPSVKKIIIFAVSFVAQIYSLTSSAKQAQNDKR